MKYRNRKRNKNIIITLILISLLIIGYSLISTNFNIGGVFTLEPVVSNVHYDENISYDSDNTVDGEVVLDGNKTTASTTVRFKKPDDKYSFVIPIVNEGTVDSMLDTITISGLTTTQQQYIKVSYEYEDGIEPTQYDLLKAGESDNLRVITTYDVDSLNNEDLPENGDHIELKINIQYLQADENANQVRTYVYTVSSTEVQLDSSIPDNITQYNNYDDAISALGSSFFIKNKLHNNIVKNNYLGFKYNGEVYYLVGGVDEVGPISRTVYERPVFYTNVVLLEDLFGYSACTSNQQIIDEGVSYSFKCETTDWTIKVSDSGYIMISDEVGSNKKYCAVDYKSMCDDYNN